MCHKSECTVRSTKGVKLKGRVDKAEARRTGESTVAATGPGEGTADQNVCNISLAVPSSQGSDHGDMRVHHTHTNIQTLNMTYKMVGSTAAGTTMKRYKRSGSTAEWSSKGVQMLEGRSDDKKTGFKGEAIEDEKGRRASGSVTPSLNDDSGDEDICHTYVVPKTTQLVPYCISPCPE
ncbi:hypothetical protein PAXRUDRAFT_170492 [Paxillus rubicundulus Ve08.2h10]|uniref:Uncharacterized protein n=1 Tax=Paxillus rubicundulus Ve08.2h10 TaxID=930991 RepID=A0A0D0DF30_9AGAM|nr:hypothetical protein PAXRUDRAFT_170492 [Paxillus rubicundulus Ve08.2h10]